jgi:tetratricopeptide (TPR) repeat protein
VTRNSFLLACAAAVVLIVAAYANSLHNSFHFDDSHVIETNLFIRSLRNVPLFFTDAHTFSSLPQNATYRPLVTLSLALDYAWGHGLDPRVFHFTQIALLLIAGALLAVFFTPLIGRAAALFAAALFCLHTANTETMNLISARSELLSTIGLLASFVLFQRSPFARRTLLYLLPLVIGALAKAPLVVFAPLLFLYVLWFDDGRRAWREALPPLVAGIALLAFLNSMNAPEWQSGGGSAYHYVITQPFVWLHYVRLFLLPVGLTADTDMGAFEHWYDTRAVAGYAFVALLVFAIVRAARRTETRPIAFGFSWFAIALMPTSLFPLAEVANEHRLFFAYIGLCLAATSWVALRARSLPSEWIAVAAALVLIAHAAGTRARNEVWRTEESLWADVVAKSPGNGRAWMNYGLTRMGKGDYAEAKRSFERAAALTPNYSILEINRGVVEGALGDDASAERHFRRALELSPEANAHFYYGRWLVQRGRGPEALPHLRDALRLSPGFAAGRALLLRLYAAAGAEREARALAAETRRIDPAAALPSWSRYDQAFGAGLAAIGRSDWLDAAWANREALRHDPRSADAFNNLGWSLQKLGFRAEAAGAYEKALAINPAFELARNNLRLLRQRPE